MEDNKKYANNGGKVTKANYIAVLGLVLLGVFTYLGQMFLTGGEMANSILWTLIVVVVCGALLFFMISAKGKESDFQKWRIVEWGCLGAYILFAICTSGSIVHFFVVNDQKNELKQVALGDIQGLEQKITDYVNFKRHAKFVTEEGLKNARNERTDSNLSDFLNQNKIQLEPGSIETYVNLQDNTLDYSDVNMKQSINSWKVIIESWSYLRVPDVARDLVVWQQKLVGDLNRKVQKVAAQLPKIEKNGAVHYLSSEKQAMEFKENNIQFREKLIKANGSSLIAWLLFVLIHFLILLNYLVAYRSLTVGIGKGNKKSTIHGGQIIG